ncbi:MAG: hypothetical protein ACK5PS_06590 [Desulfopila sp.]
MKIQRNVRQIVFVFLLISAVIDFLFLGNARSETVPQRNVNSTQRVNPYNGVYYFDISKIENPKILQSATIQRKNGYEPLTLSIEDSGAFLLGYQFDSKVRNRFFTVCLTEDLVILHNGDLGVLDSDYCRIPENNKFSLEFKQLSDNTLICKNCEKEEFPSYWIKAKD